MLLTTLPAGISFTVTSMSLSPVPAIQNSARRCPTIWRIIIDCCKTGPATGKCAEPNLALCLYRPDAVRLYPVTRGRQIIARECATESRNDSASGGRRFSGILSDEQDAEKGDLTLVVHSVRTDARSVSADAIGDLGKEETHCGRNCRGWIVWGQPDGVHVHPRILRSKSGH